MTSTSCRRRAAPILGTALASLALVAAAISVPANALGLSSSESGSVPPPPSADSSVELTLATVGIIETGAAVEFTATATEDLVGLPATLQRRDAKKSRWLTVGKTVVDDEGTMVLSGRAGTLGTTKWRVKVTYKPTKGKPTAFLSNLVPTPVYSWFFLTREASPVDDGGSGGADAWERSTTVGGQAYPNSIVIGPGNPSRDWEFPAWSEYNVSYRCVTLKSFVGIDDRSESGVNASFYVDVDGARSQVATKGLGPATEISIDITNSLRVRFEAVPNSVNVWGQGSFGDIRVLCNKAP